MMIHEPCTMHHAPCTMYHVPCTMYLALGQDDFLFGGNRRRMGRHLPLARPPPLLRLLLTRCHHNRLACFSPLPALLRGLVAIGVGCLLLQLLNSRLGLRGSKCLALSCCEG